MGLIYICWGLPGWGNVNSSIFLLAALLMCLYVWYFPTFVLVNYLSTWFLKQIISPSLPVGFLFMNLPIYTLKTFNHFIIPLTGKGLQTLWKYDMWLKKIPYSCWTIKLSGIIENILGQMGMVVIWTTCQCILNHCLNNGVRTWFDIQAQSLSHQATMGILQPR